MTFESGTYHLFNVKATKKAREEGGKDVALDLSGTDESSVIAWEHHDGDNQKWEFQEKDGGYVVKNCGLGKYLSFDGSPENGTPVIGKGEEHVWEVKTGHEGVNVKDSKISLRLFAPGTNYNVDLSGHGDGSNANKVQLWERTAGQGQAWYFEKL